MSKCIIVLSVLLASLNSTYSQNMEQQVVASSGDDVISGEVQLSWTLGEVVTSSTSGSSILLVEGFHQNSEITILLSVSPEENAITIYPNPTTDFIQVNTSTKQGLGSYQLQSIKGEILLSNQKADFTRANTIDLMDYARGIYLLTIEMPDQKPQQFKIVKK